MTNLLRDVQPDEFCNLAAQLHIDISFEVPEYTAEATGVGVIKILETIRHPRRRLFTRAVLMSPQNFIPIGAPSITANFTAYSPATAYHTVCEFVEAAFQRESEIFPPNRSRFAFGQSVQSSTRVRLAKASFLPRPGKNDGAI